MEWRPEQIVGKFPMKASERGYRQQFPRTPLRAQIEREKQWAIAAALSEGDGTDDLNDEQVQREVDKLNYRPRKALGYRTPHGVFFEVKVRYTE